MGWASNSDVGPLEIMSLKPKVQIGVGMTFGGLVLCWIGLPWAIIVGGYLGLLPGVVGLLGIVWIVLGTMTLVRRRKLVIKIDEFGIELPAFGLLRRKTRSVFISRGEIAGISKHESLKGRMIEITTCSGDSVLIYARHYCSLDQFIAHCRREGLPVR